jgi:hypothetical protein
MRGGVLVALTFLTAAPALPADDDWSGYTMVKSEREIPVAVMQALTDLCRPCTFADIDARWNASDVMMGNLPSRRLLRAGHTDTEWAIEYEHGGRGVHTHSVAFSIYPSVHYLRGSSCQPAEGRRCEW